MGDLRGRSQAGGGAAMRLGGYREEGVRSKGYSAKRSSASALISEVLQHAADGVK